VLWDQKRNRYWSKELDIILSLKKASSTILIVYPHVFSTDIPQPSSVAVSGLPVSADTAQDSPLTAVPVSDTAEPWSSPRSSSCGIHEWNTRERAWRQQRPWCVLQNRGNRLQKVCILQSTSAMQSLFHLISFPLLHWLQQQHLIRVLY